MELLDGIIRRRSLTLHCGGSLFEVLNISVCHRQNFIPVETVMGIILTQCAQNDYEEKSGFIPPLNFFNK